MKRLLDDPTDEVTRLLIQAAVDHQPPPAGKMRLMTALGMGSGFSLLSTEVFAWLSTAVGKATLGVATLGVAAGGVYSASTEHEPQTPAKPVPVSVAPARVERSAPVENAYVSETLPIQSRAADKPQRPPTLTNRSRATEKAAVPTAIERDARRLGEETRWVDRLKLAAENGDKETLRRLFASYAEKFPEGQLKPEVDRIKKDL